MAEANAGNTEYFAGSGTGAVPSRGLEEVGHEMVGVLGNVCSRLGKEKY
jgi:hypothetical protein